MGLNFTVLNNNGLVVANNTGAGTQASVTGAGGTGSLLNSGANIPVILDAGKISLAITATQESEPGPHPG